MAILTSTYAELNYEGVKVAKCRDLTITINRDALETTRLGDWDRSFLAGLRGSTGSATLLYDPLDTSVTGLLNSVFADTTATVTLDVVFDRVTAKKLTVEAVLTEVGPSIAFGEAIACSVNFQVSGKFTGTF